MQIVRHNILVCLFGGWSAGVLQSGLDEGIGSHAGVFLEACNGPLLVEMEFRFG